MLTRRILILALAPLPIVFGSICAARWAREDPNRCASRNEVLGAAERRAGEDVSALTEPCGMGLERRCQIAARQIQGSLNDVAVIVRSPLVIGGDLAEEALQGWYDQTILPAMQAMQHVYFRNPPVDPVTILLFSQESTYRGHARQQFGNQPVSIYGYYQPVSRTLVINLAAGGGTLVHELTHALIDFDHPTAPIWFNEGLASLHEHCQLHDDAGTPVIRPLINWRLEILQAALLDGRLPPLRALMQKPDLRGPQEAVDYAQARYFCFFLHQQGVLPAFYASLRAQGDQDPCGEHLVPRFFPGRTWPEIEQAFRDWVLLQTSYTSYERQNQVTF